MGLSMKEKLDEIVFEGHPNVTGLHRNTIEVTKDSEISKKADCIIGVNATKSCADLNMSLKDWIRSGSWLEFEIIAGMQSFTFEGRGSPKLDLTDKRELVLRKSDYVSSRTAALNCSHSARDLPRALVSRLKDPGAEGKLIFRSLPHPKTDSFVWTLP